MLIYERWYLVTLISEDEDVHERDRCLLSAHLLSAHDDTDDWYLLIFYLLMTTLTTLSAHLLSAHDDWQVTEQPPWYLTMMTLTTTTLTTEHWRWYLKTTTLKVMTDIWQMTEDDDTDDWYLMMISEDEDTEGEDTERWYLKMKTEELKMKTTTFTSPPRVFWQGWRWGLFLDERCVWV